jgi:hypothetical protein
LGKITYKKKIIKFPEWLKCRPGKEKIKFLNKAAAKKNKILEIFFYEK